MLEFEIVSGATDAIVTPFSGGLFTQRNTSVSWQIQDVRIVADTVTVDNGLQNSYAEHALSGRPLPISYSTCVTSLQRCVFPNISVSVARAVSQLKTLFLTLTTQSYQLML